MNSLQKKYQNQESDTLSYMYEVQKTLFDAYKDPNLFIEALKLVADKLTAERACFLGVQSNQVREIFVSSDYENVEFYNKERIFALLSKANGYILKGNSLLLYEGDIARLDEESRTELKNRDIRSLMLTPVMDASGTMIGVLAAFNMNNHWENCRLLERISSDFLMACTNIRLAMEIRLMNMTDAVTGLKSRQFYKEALDNLDKKLPEELCCLYIDANGLHVLNNTLGHSAGDDMLRRISDSLKELFGWEECYRIGGDEFVVLAAMADRADIENKISVFNSQLEPYGYCASIGEAWLSESKDLGDLMVTAERRMYDSKREYYKRAANETNVRFWNEKLEEILVQKRDGESFMNIISSRFMGVYVVDFNTDVARVIYEPPYFKELLKLNNYRFASSMQEYISLYVREEDRAKILELLDYEAVEARLSEVHRIKVHFTKKDGEKISLLIYKAIGHGNENSDTVWMFETDIDNPN